MLPPSLPETNTTGKRTGLSTETQALLHGVVRFPSFTPTPARPFRVASPQLAPCPGLLLVNAKVLVRREPSRDCFSALK